jgi:hypothetical protein
MLIRWYDTITNRRIFMPNKKAQNKTRPPAPCVIVSNIRDVPDNYQTYPDLKQDLINKYPLVNDGLLAYRVAIRHRVKNVPYYKVTGEPTYYDPKTFEEELKMEQEAKEHRQTTQGVTDEVPKA